MKDENCLVALMWEITVEVNINSLEMMERIADA